MCEDLEKFKIEMPGARIIIYWTVDKWDRLWINFPGKYSRAEFTEEMEYNFCQFLLKRLNRRGYIIEKGQLHKNVQRGIRKDEDAEDQFIKNNLRLK